MEQEGLCETEWNSPSNWSSRGFLGLYFSKRDPRIWVPKAMPSLGWTVNLAHPAGAVIFISLLLSPAVVLAAFMLFT